MQLFIPLCRNMKTIVTYKRYFEDFLSKLQADECKKIAMAVSLLKTEDKIPRHFINFLCDGIYELRVTCKKNEFRVFFIYDGDKIIVLFNAYKKKTSKTPIHEKELAKRLKKEYEATKGNK